MEGKSDKCAEDGTNDQNSEREDVIHGGKGERRKRNVTRQVQAALARFRQFRYV